MIMADITEILRIMKQDRPELQKFPVVDSSPLPNGQFEQPGEEPPRGSSRPGTTAERIKERKYLYDHFRKVFIVHFLAPSERKGQDYDIFIYLKRHQDESLSDVTKAEFFFGDSWGNRIFEGQHEGDVIGVRVSAYGSGFLCTCLVTFEDGEQVSLYRYIDFEMGKIIAGLQVK
jgi:hypothetical protein